MVASEPIRTHVGVQLVIALWEMSLVISELIIFASLMIEFHNCSGHMRLHIGKSLNCMIKKNIFKQS